MASFVDFAIINELSRDLDAYYRSQYFYKDRGGKLTAGPLWDFDLTFGVGGYFGNEQVQGWQYQQTRQPIAFDWFTVLMQDPAFVNQVKVRWQELRRGILSDTAAPHPGVRADRPAHRRRRRATSRGTRTCATRMIGPFITSTTGTWQGQVSELQSWMLRRAAWLDTSAAWGGPTTPVTPTPTPSPTPTAFADAPPHRPLRRRPRRPRRPRRSPVAPARPRSPRSRAGTAGSRARSR